MKLKWSRRCPWMCFGNWVAISELSELQELVYSIMSLQRASQPFSAIFLRLFLQSIQWWYLFALSMFQCLWFRRVRGFCSAESAQRVTTFFAALPGNIINPLFRDPFLINEDFYRDLECESRASEWCSTILESKVQIHNFLLGWVICCSRNAVSPHKKIFSFNKI